MKSLLYLSWWNLQTRFISFHTFQLTRSHTLSYHFLQSSTNSAGAFYLLGEKGTRNLANFLKRRPDCTSDCKLARNSLHSVSRIDVLDENNLIARSTPLAGNNGRPREEDLPNL